ncbi:MAG: RND transporter [Gammaproteobacteria bacterium]|nr:RND transporter [Gammaproteobacteria bacterium]
MKFRFAKWIMDHRGSVGIVFIFVTLGFSIGIPDVQIRTVFKDLLPTDDPFVKVYFDHPNFGNPLLISVMVKRKQGDIYHPDTLKKVWQMTRDLDLGPKVNHDTLISITTEKLRYAEATPYGVDLQPLMDNNAPSTPEEVEEFKERVSKSPNARTFYISPDETATLINIAFLDSVDYGEAFNFVQDLVEKARDADHEVYVAGQPTLTGWVYKLQKQTYSIFGVTVGALIIALMLYMRNVAGVTTPIVCSFVAALWGFGFIGWLGRPIEPLLMIVPLLLVARSFSHCVQYTERYYEILMHLKDRRKAAEVTMAIMMAPSILGIMTDVFGIIFIAVAPITTMVNHALFCGFWALWIIPTGVFLISILLSYLPAPKNLEEIVGGKEKESGVHLLEEKVLAGIAKITVGKAANVTMLVTVVLTVISVYVNSLIKIGNPVEGSNLLWYESEYNTAVRALNAHFPGMNTLEIVLEAKERSSERRIARTPETVAAATTIQRIMESDATSIPRATLSFSDYMGEVFRLFSGGNPKWLNLDPTDTAVANAGFAATFGTSPMNFATISDFEFQNSTVSVWFKDNKQETVDAALASARRAVKAAGDDHPTFRIRLGSGVIALQQAMNNVVKRYHWFILGLVNVAVMVIAAYAYRSIVASLILLVPVNISNFMLGASMYTLGIGFDINATIVAVMGVGVGIDYGIYLLSRICEEYGARNKNLKAAIHASLVTTGKAILFTASIMLMGILPWYFLSDLKFMADMGLLLVAIMLINMVLSLVALPLMVWYVKPKFLDRDDLMVGENVDLSQFALGTTH